MGTLFAVLKKEIQEPEKTVQCGMAPCSRGPMGWNGRIDYQKLSSTHTLNKSLSF